MQFRAWHIFIMGGGLLCALQGVQRIPGLLLTGTSPSHDTKNVSMYHQIFTREQICLLPILLAAALHEQINSEIIDVLMMPSLLTMKIDSLVGLFQLSNVILQVLNVEFFYICPWICSKAFDTLFYYKCDFPNDLALTTVLFFFLYRSRPWLEFPANVIKSPENKGSFISVSIGLLLISLSWCVVR